MVYDYVVTLQNRSRKWVDRFSLLTIATSVLFFSVNYVAGPEKRNIHLLGALLITGLTAFNMYRRSRGAGAVYYNYILMITGLVWASMPFSPWLFFPLLVMGLLERQAKKNLEIGFHKEGVVFNSFPRKKYTWSDFENIVLRGNLLTLDFADNRLLQRETIDEEGDADEDEFNAWCRAHLA